MDDIQQLSLCELAETRAGSIFGTLLQNNLPGLQGLQIPLPPPPESAPIESVTPSAQKSIPNLIPIYHPAQTPVVSFFDVFVDHIASSIAIKTIPILP